MTRGDFEAPDAVARRRRRRELAGYLALHQERLEKIAQRCANRVLLERPLDPYEALLHLLSEHTQEGICFSKLRVWPQAPNAVALEVSAEARGSVLSVHRTELPGELVEKGLPGPAGAEAELPPEGRLRAAAARLRAAVGDALRGVKALDFQELDRRLLKAVAGGDDGPSEDAAALCAALAGELLAAAGCLLDSSAVEAVRSGLELRKEVEPGPPLTCQEDLQAWERCWPELLLASIQGSTPKRRFCVGASLWAALLPDAASAAGGPAPAWVDVAARAAREAAIVNADAADVEVEDPDEAPAAEPDELCPPTNAVAVALALADAVAAKVAAEVPSLGDDLSAPLGAFRRALEALLPRYLRPPNGSSATAEADNQPVDQEDTKLVTLAEQQWRDSLYCTLHLDADAAFDPATGSYTFSPGGVARSQAELVEHYASLVEAEPLLRVLVAPLSPRDEGSLAALRARLPPEVLIIQEPPAPGAGGGSCPASPALQGLSGLGLERDTGLTPLGLVAHCEAQSQLYIGKCGLYDFSERRGCLPSINSYLDVSMALPEQRRFFLLPKDCGGTELPRPLQALDQHLCQLISSAYGQQNAQDGREKHRNLNFPQWREGLRRLNYADVDQYAEPLFKFLDVSNNGSISTNELKVMQDISGPASLQDLDELRIWLSWWHEQQSQRRQEAGAEGTETGAAEGTGTSPLSELWQRMDANGSGLASFGEFRRALRKIRHPAAVEGNDGKLQELFMCLDLNSNGNIGEDDFHCLNVLSAKFQLDRLIRVRDFLKERFGTLKAAFKAMDENRSGTLSKEEWMSVMEGKQSYPVLEDCSVCFQFFDRDGSNILTSKEFDLLGSFDEEKLLDDTQSLYETLCDKYPDLEQAFDFFLSRGSSRPCTPVRRSIDAKDFLAGCRSLQFKGSTEPRLLFNFLDAMHVGRITISEFVQMGKLGAVVLMVGCGNSSFSAELHEAGYRHITNIDISSAAVDKMEAKYRHLGMEWQVMDATAMEFGADRFGLVVEKGTLDGMKCGNSSDKALAMVAEIYRTLRPGGVFVLVSHNGRRQEVLDSALQTHHQGLPGWEHLERRKCRLSPQATLINVLRSKLKGKPLSEAFKNPEMLREAAQETKASLKRMAFQEVFRLFRARKARERKAAGEDTAEAAGAEDDERSEEQSKEPWLQPFCWVYVLRKPCASSGGT